MCGSHPGILPPQRGQNPRPDAKQDSGKQASFPVWQHLVQGEAETFPELGKPDPRIPAVCPGDQDLPHEQAGESDIRRIECCPVVAKAVKLYRTFYHIAKFYIKWCESSHANLFACYRFRAPFRKYPQSPAQAVPEAFPAGYQRTELHRVPLVDLYGGELGLVVNQPKADTTTKSRCCGI